MKLRSLPMMMCLVPLCMALDVAAQVAQDKFPTRPVRLIAPYPPGGGADFTGREIAQKLTEAWGQQVVVDNRPGAGTAIGHDIVAKSRPDGYTLGLGSAAGMAVNPVMGTKLPYDALKDFSTIGLIVSLPFIVAVPTALPANNMRELIALAKAQPGKLNFASPGMGTPNHLGGEMLKMMTGINIVHVAYKGAGPLMVDQIGGHIMLSFTAPIVSKPHIDSAKLRAIAVTSEKRWPGLPSVPSVAESGYPGFDVYVWVALFAPAGTPRPIIDKIAADVTKTLESQEIKERFAGASIEVGASTPDGLAQFMKKDFELWDKLIKSQGIKLD